MSERGDSLAEAAKGGAAPLDQRVPWAVPEAGFLAEGSEGWVSFQTEAGFGSQCHGLLGSWGGARGLLSYPCRPLPTPDGLHHKAGRGQLVDHGKQALCQQGPMWPTAPPL